MRPVSNEMITAAGSAGSRCVMNFEVHVILSPYLPHPQQNNISTTRVLNSVLGIHGKAAAIQAAISQNLVIPY
jgi:hypothetical protein